jgi:integrase
MAYWFRKPNGHVYVLYMKDGKPKALPRSQTRALDQMPDEYIKSYTKEVGLKYEGKAITPDNLLVGHDKLEGYLKAYLTHLAHRRRRDRNTVRTHDQMLREVVFPFFLEGDKPLPDPTDWPSRSAHMLAWMEKRELSYDTQMRANSACRGLHRFLVEERLIAGSIELLLRNPIKKEALDVDELADRTPLRRVIMPDEVVAFAKSGAPADMRLLALLGYFFSLRPGEAFAFQPHDLLAGTHAHRFECALAMRRIDLFDRLVMDVRRQRTSSGQIRVPKAHSSGKVACFHKEAAQLIVSMVKEHAPKEPIFRFHSRHLYRLWERGGLPGVTLKDLRRASVYWLGHYTQIELGNLQKHARHKYASTTQLYMRRPGEARSDEAWTLDLDA